MKTRTTLTLLVAILALASAATAIAAHPKGGSRLSGYTSESPINGFKAPVTFSVAPSGATLLNFTYASLGCVGSGGFSPGVDYFTKPFNTIKVGKVKLSKSGHFSESGAPSSYTAFGDKTTTTTKVTGSFTSSKNATGTITFSQQISGKFTTSCGPANISFTAKGH
jgi:hypothetical protein